MKKIYLSFIIIYLILIFYFSSIPVPEPLKNKPDIILHLIEYGGLGFLFTGYFTDNFKKELKKNELIFIFIFILVYAISDEFHQSFIKGRDSSIKDIISDTIGGIIVPMISLKIKKKGGKMDNMFLRQIGLIGEVCQKKLSESTLLIAGVGGLGGLTAELLTRVGIGKLYIVDDGIVDTPDLNRQVLYTIKDIGKKKVDIATKRLKNISGKTEIIPIFKKIDNHFEIPPDTAGIIDCLDNFKARYLIDKLANRKNIFLIHGAISGWYGQITTIVPDKTKSLKEIFPDIKDDNSIVPVLGFTPSLVSSLQVSEAIKQLCDIRDNLENRILFIDLKHYSFEIVELSR